MKPGSSAWRDAHWGVCEQADTVVETFAGGVRLCVARLAVEAYDALFATMAAHAYPVRREVTGSYNCRKITGGSVYSAHAYGLAVDVNWDTNPYGRKLVTDMPLAMVEAIQEIRTTGGVRVWKWGGDWDHRPDTPHTVYDAMHFEVIATPDELAAGIDRSIDHPQIRAWPLLRHGSRGPAVRHLQELLEIAVDGAFGNDTLAAVRTFQVARGLKVDGKVGPQTWTALTYSLPEVRHGEIGPDKRIVKQPAAQEP